MTGLIDQLASGLIKKDRADEAVRKSKQKDWRVERGREILVSLLCGASRGTSSGRVQLKCDGTR
jgi:hypothetical protein